MPKLPARENPAFEASESDATPPKPAAAVAAAGRRSAAMTYFLVIGEGPQAPEPIQHVAVTAIEAELHCSRLRRLCGKSGKVEVWGKDGRKVSADKLDSLVRLEKAAAGET